ncbi:MAG: hypothetical protein ACXWUG_22040 [Polyangiales bacterium]
MSDPIDPTAVNVTVRVLLRMPMQEEPVRIAGIHVAIVGPAASEGWPGVAVEEGDLEGIHWTSREELSSVIALLRESPSVIAVVA